MNDTEFFAMRRRAEALADQVKLVDSSPVFGTLGPRGQRLKHYRVVLNGGDYGNVHQYTAYSDRKPAGCRYVTSRREVVRWGSSAPLSFDLTSRKAALQELLEHLLKTGKLS